MVYEIRVPELGEGISECSVLNWNKNRDDEVTEGDVLCELEVEKSVMEVASPGNGVLRLVLNEGREMLPVGALLAVVAGPDDDISSFE